VNTYGASHPLVGRIYSRRDDDLVTPDVLLHAIADADVVLLGEIHDDADQHALQARLIDAWLSRHRDGSVAFEMLDETQRAALDSAPGSPQQLAARVRWDETGWPDFSLYRPLFDVIFSHHAGIVAAHPSRERIRACMIGQCDPGPGDLFLAPDLGVAQLSALRTEIVESHCGFAPAGMVEAMMRAQRFKDAFMARALREAGPRVLLVAGAGHVREDRGVPMYLRRAGVLRAVSVRMASVDEGQDDPRAYDARAYDFVVFTPRVSDDSPCDRFKEQLERMRRVRPGS
jgi:uncharacterized iron-regulated protein